MLVIRVLVWLNLFREGYVDDRLAVRRDVRKPVVVLVVGQLFLVAAIRLHTPDLHHSTPGRVEVDVLAVGRILRTIVHARTSGQLAVLATPSRNTVDVKVPVALASKDEEPAIGGPTVQIGRTLRGDALGV